MTHTKECLANAMISAIQNLRDASDSDFDFRIAIQENTPLAWADSYLAAGEGTVTCFCPCSECGAMVGTATESGMCADCEEEKRLSDSDHRDYLESIGDDFPPVTGWTEFATDYPRR